MRRAERKPRGADGLLLAAAVVMVVMSGAWGNTQWYALLALPLLALYNEKRGKARLKYLFYIFYPAHLVLIHGIKLLFM